VETQRLEEQARRRQEEKERRVKQQQAVAQAEKETAEKIAARAFARVRVCVRVGRSDVCRTT
jgi:hypothetical protein